MIITETNPLLRLVAQPVTNFGSTELKELIELMFQVMRQKNGVGLAAPQIGVSERIFVYGFEINTRYPNMAAVPNTIIINPEIAWTSEEMTEMEEGCLSIPNRRGSVTRHKSITFTSKDIDGVVYEKTVHDFEARIVQHEMDHINGILISDRTKSMYSSI